MTTTLQVVIRRNRYRKRLFCFLLLCMVGTAKLIWDITAGINNWQSDNEENDLFAHISKLDEGNLNRHSVYYKSRELLEVQLANCTPPAIEQFPYPLLSRNVRLKGGITLHIFLAAYMFLALAIVCDDYFVPACEKLCDVLNLQSDVAGATFMAAGSSAPELATAVIGVFIAKDDIGLGAVVGSAVFNIMFVISVCALFAGMVVYLKWWPIFRDSLFYTVSILALVIVILDDEVQWYESLVLLILYVCYIVIMIFNPKLEAFFVSRYNNCFYRKDVKNRDKNEMSPVVNESSSPTGHHTFNLVQESDNEKDNEEASEFHSLLHNDSPNTRLHQLHPLNGTHTGSTPDVEVKTHLDEDDDESPFSVPQGCCKRFLWVISLPLIAMLFITIPDCRKERWKSWWLVSFILSCSWIGVYSYLMVWMITIVGSTFQVPDTVMGLTFIAAGASVPDAIASLLVCQDGFGDMAISNAIGSNVFDILLCLGLPYFVKSVVINGGEPVEVYSRGLTYSSMTLLTTVVFLLVSIHLNGWKLDKKYGVLLMVVYFFFNILAILYELNIFGYFHPPECPTSL